MGREHQLFGGWLRTFSSISRIFLISCSHGWPFVLQHLATSCVVLARLDWQMDYWMEFSRSIQTIPDHSRTKGLEGCVSLPKICLTSRVSAGLPTIAGCQAAGGIANVASFARWRKMGWVTGPRWWGESWRLGQSGFFDSQHEHGSWLMSPLNITQPLGIWSMPWLLFQVMSNIPKMGQLPTPTWSLWLTA